MALFLKALAFKFIAGRTVGGVFGLLSMLLVPLAAVLNFIGIPMLIVLALVGAPIFLLLGALGLPVVFVVGIGGALLLLVGVVLALGVIAIKIALPIILIVWFVKWLRRPRPATPVVPPDAEPGMDAI